MSDCADVLFVCSVPAVHVRPRPPDIVVPLVWNRVDHDSARFVAVTFASSWRIVPVTAHADPDIVNGCCCYQWIPARLQVCDLSMQYGMDGTPLVVLSSRPCAQLAVCNVDEDVKWISPSTFQFSSSDVYACSSFERYGAEHEPRRMVMLLLNIQFDSAASMPCFDQRNALLSIIIDIKCSACHAQLPCSCLSISSARPPGLMIITQSIIRTNYIAQPG